MNIKNVKIKNFKGIKIIDVSTEKNMIVITGPNGAGKSSFCDAIMTCLAGKDKAITRPIRNGESKAEIEVELDGYVAQRVFKSGKHGKVSNILHVTPTGKIEPIKAPQAWLNEHIGNLKFDPSDFARMDEVDQREMLMELAGLDLEAEDKKIDSLFEERKFLGRELKGMVNYEIDESVREYAEKEEVNIISLMEKISDNNRNKIKHTENIARINTIDIEIQNLKKEQENLINENSTITVLPDEEANNLQVQVDNSEEKNNAIREAKEAVEGGKKYEAKFEEHRLKGEELEKARDEKKQLIEAATYPIEGLSVDDDGVLYNDVPFSQVNDSQKIVIGTLIALALVPEGGIKIIFIKLGSLLDDNALAYLEKVSLEQDAKIIIEFVGEDNKGFKIVEGEIVKEKL